MAVEFGKYVLHERIGTGGMAEVYRATAEGPGGFEKEFALKRILVQHDQDPDFVNMFIDEARIAVALSHPNVAQVFEFDQVDDTYYLAMEYVPGKDLQTVLKRSEKLGVPFTPDLALHTAMEVCKGLYAAHRATDTSGELLHVIHRDISPQNVQISFSGDVKILDFGVAKARDKLVKTQAGAIRGKLLYMPPEQVRAKAVDHRADIFSLGLVLYKALTGENPYQAPTEIQILERMAHCEIEPPSTVTPGLPEGIDEAVMRALAVSPDDRFPDAAAMHDALAEVLRRTYPGMSWSALGDHMHRLFQEEAELSDTHEALPASPPPTIVTPLPGVPATAPSALALGARMPEQEEGRTRSDAGGTLALPDPAEESADPSGVFGSAPGAQAAGSGAQAAGSGAQAAGSGGWAGRPASDTGSEASGEAIPAEDSAPLPVPDEEPTHRRRGRVRPWGWLALGGGLAAAAVVAVALAVAPSSKPDPPPPAAAPVAEPPKPGTITIRSEPVGAEVFLDGERLAGEEVDGEMRPRVTPAEVPGVPPGHHELRLEIPGYVSWRGELDVEPGGRSEVVATLSLTPGRLKVTSTPAGATVELDGRRLGLTPLSRDGIDRDREYTLVLTLAGHAPYEETLVFEGEELEVEARLGKASRRPRPGGRRGFGYLSLNSIPSAKVYLDGRDLGRMTPMFKLKVKAGRHRVRLHAPALDRSRELIVDIEPGAAMRRSVHFEK